jgi:hydrogenase-4 component B
MIQLAFNSFLTALLSLPGVTLCVRKSKRGGAISSFLLLATMIVGTAIGARCWLYGNVVALNLSWLAPFPFTLTVDRLSAFFLLLICAVGAPVVLFSTSYVERHYLGASRTWISVLLPWFLLSMVLVVTASTGFAFLLGWELMTLASAGLILTDGDSEERRHNIFVYLLMMHAGAATVIAAFLLFAPVAPGLAFIGIRAAAATLSPGMRAAVFLLAFIGFGAKAGIIPLHLWLPKAHPIAPSPVSALMSGVMLKTAVYGFVRFAFDFLGTGPSWWGYLVLIAGAVSGVLGVLYAIAEHDLKRLLAYHSVENIGIIYMALGASLILTAQNAPMWAAVALCAALLHCLNHGLFKSLLFLGAGAVSDATHTLDIEELGGLLRRMPASGTALLIACCSIVGLPLFNGFISEWLAFRSFLAGAELTNVAASIVLPLSIGVLGLIGGLAVACFAKVYGVAFLGRPRSEEAEHAHEVPPAMRAGMMALATACVAIGVLPRLVVLPLANNVQDLVRGGALPPEIATFIRFMPWVAVAVIAAGLAFAAIRRTKRVTATWACGLPALDARMQYTSTAFSKPLRKVFADVYRPERKVEVLPADEPYFPASVSYSSVRTTSFEKSLYRPGVEAVVSISRRLRSFQTGNIQVYLLYLFLALIGVLLFMRFA